MTINAAQFSSQIVIPTLEMLQQVAGIPYTNLMYHETMGTIAQESLLGTFLVQNSGPALGIGQIEPASLATTLAALTPSEKTALASLATPASAAHNVVGNLPYAVAMVRLYYRHKPGLPKADTVTALAVYWKTWYNTSLGAGTVQQFIQNFALTGINLAI